MSTRSPAKIASDKRYRKTEKYKEAFRKRRKTPKYKAYAKKLRKAYYDKNKEREKALNLLYLETHRDEIYAKKNARRRKKSDIDKLIEERLATLPKLESVDYYALLE